MRLVKKEFTLEQKKTLAQASPSVHTWERANEGCVKINFDAAFRQGSH